MTETMSRVRERVITDWDSPACELLERVVDRMEERGVNPDYILGLRIANPGCDWFSIEEKTIYTTVDVIDRHNGTRANVSVMIHACVKTGRFTAKRICGVKVPKDASDRVIDRRIDQVLASIDAQ